MENLDGLTKRIIAISRGRQRTIIAIAGPPASGKSTLSDKLQQAINDTTANKLSSGEICAVVPMDGFHLDNSQLDKLGLRQVKGAPQTFDAAGFIELIRRLKEDPGEISIPTFDRQLDGVIANGAIVGPGHRIILTEGNYLLLERQPWPALRQYFDFSIFVDPGLELLESRLVERWKHYGLTPDEARIRALSNDIPNALLVLEGSGNADLRLPGF